MGDYQTFPGRRGASLSRAKLDSLALPNLSGKTFLDLGCNEGYFCGYAWFEGARSITGVDQNPDLVNAARRRFPTCNFIEDDWVAYLAREERLFDVIICLSAFHYAADPEEFLAAMVAHLGKKGILVVELGISEGNEECITGQAAPDWVMCQRSVNSRAFPTWSGVHRLLKPYVWRYIGKSVNQAGDDIPRHIFWVHRPLPLAVFLIGESARGKSSVWRKLFSHELTLHGDHIWKDIAPKKDLYPALGRILDGMETPPHPREFIDKIFQGGAEREFVDFMLDAVQERNFVYEGYIPEPFHEVFIDLFKKGGYFPVKMELPELMNNPWEMKKLTRQEARKYEMYLTATRWSEGKSR